MTSTQAPRRPQARRTWRSIFVSFLASAAVVALITFVLWLGLAFFTGYWSLFFIILGSLLVLRLAVLELRSDR